MKIFLASDIHTEHATEAVDPNSYSECLDFDYPEAADVIVLAGDIGEGVLGLEWAANKFIDKPIIYVAGNHEYYNNDLSVINDMRLKAKELGIFFLENDEVIINDVRFLGCTLWTDFNRYDSGAIEEAWQVMNNYRFIKCVDWWASAINRDKALALMDLDNQFGFDPDLFSPTVAYLFHRKSLEWLSNRINKNHDGKTVVITHHCPTMQYTCDFSYGSNLEKFIANRSDKIDCWMHGHIHQSVDYKVAGVRVICNPRGYPSDYYLSRSFNQEKLLCL